MPCPLSLDYVAPHCRTHAEPWYRRIEPIHGACVHEDGSPYDANDLESQYDAVRCFLVSLCRDADVANDLVQETYLRAYLNLSRHGRPIDRPRQWLITIARCTYIDRVRYESVRPWSNRESFDDVADTRRRRPSAGVQVREDMGELREAIDELDPLTRDLLVGFHIDGECFADLAARHGVSPTMARVRVFRARRLLRQKRV